MERTPRAHPGDRPAWRRPASAVALALAIGAGCTQPGPLTRRQTMVGALKADVAQLESEKDQLAREVNDLKAENRRAQTEMAELEDRNGDLSARLDDARAVMSRQGLDDGQTSRSASDSDRPTPRRSTPVRSQPKGRKSPFAQIPPERRSLDDEDDSSRGDTPTRPSRSRDDESSSQSRLDDRSPWLPVARGDGPAPRRVQ